MGICSCFHFHPFPLPLQHRPSEWTPCPQHFKLQHHAPIASPFLPIEILFNTYPHCQQQQQLHKNNNKDNNGTIIMTTTKMTTFEGHRCTAGLHSTLVVYYGYCVLLYFVELLNTHFFTSLLSYLSESLTYQPVGAPQTCRYTSNPHPYPWKPIPIGVDTGAGCQKKTQGHLWRTLNIAELGHRGYLVVLDVYVWWVSCMRLICIYWLNVRISVKVQGP